MAAVVRLVPALSVAPMPAPANALPRGSRHSPFGIRTAARDPAPTTVLTFAVVVVGAAAVFFFIVKFLGWIMKLKKEDAITPPPPPPLTKDQELLGEIRDLLKVR